MGIPDRIILTLYTFLMAVVAVLVVYAASALFRRLQSISFWQLFPATGSMPLAAL